MKKTLTLFLFFILICSNLFSQNRTQDSIPTITLFVTAVIHRIECDNPPIEIYNSHNEDPKANPYPNQAFYIYSGALNDTNKIFVKQLITDNNGNFSLDLPIGKYSIQQLPQHMISPHYLQSNYDGIISVELYKNEIWMEAPYYEVDIQENLHLTFHFYQSCPFPSGPDRM